MKSLSLILVGIFTCLRAEPVSAEGLWRRLDWLVKRADVIALVERVRRAETPSGPVEFRVVHALKGEPGEAILICNAARATESYDMNGHNAKSLIVFLKHSRGCLKSWEGLNSTIMVRGDVVLGALQDQPAGQSTSMWIEKIRGQVEGSRRNRSR